MRIGTLVSLGFILLSTAWSQTLPLTYRPVTAEYSYTLDRIILVSANPNQLHVFDPATNTESVVNLPKPPLSLSVSLDGLHAAVGHDALVSYVNLSSGALEKTLTAPLTVNSLALGNDYIYILTYNAGTATIQISTGTIATNGIYNGTQGRIHPSGRAIYTTEDGLSPEHLQDLDISAGTIGNVAQGPYHGDYPVCGGVWFSPDGHRAYTGCGAAYQAAPQNAGGFLTLGPTLDGMYWATLSGAAPIRSLSESASLNRIALIPYTYQYTTGPAGDNQVYFYDSAYLEPAGIFNLPDFSAGSKTYPAHGQQIFYNKASTALYVVMQADGSAGLLNDFAVQVFPVGNPPACTPTFAGASATVAAGGTLTTIGITAPAACIYQAASTADWIQLVSGAYGSGAGTLTYVARPNRGAARTGTITLGSQTFTVTQLAAAASTGALAQLSYSVAGAEYSKALDKLVLIVANPKELHILDPTTGSDQIVPLPKTPLCVSVGPDGLTAAVGYDGFISLVNLSTAAVTKTLQTFTDVHTILLGGTGYVYAYPLNTWGHLFSIQTSTGAMTIVTSIYDGRLPRLYADGTVYYTEGSKWDISQGAAKELTQNFNGICAPFWLTEDGARALTACNKVYTTSSVPAQDLQYNGSFSNVSNGVQWAAESAKLHSTAVIPGVPAFGIPTNDDTFLQMYGDAYLGYTGNLALPGFQAGSTSYAGHGRYVFWNSAADKLIVLVQADSSAKLAADYGLAVYPLTVPAAGCMYTLGAASASFDKNGGLNTVAVNTGAGCIWQATSNASWITVNAGAVGFGANSVGYTAAPNTGAARTGTLTIAGQNFQVTQAAGAVSGGTSPANVTPSSGSGLSRTMTFNFNDTRGYQDLDVVNILIGSFLDGRNACYLAYSRPNNVLYLVNDPGTALLTGLTLNGSGSTGNSQCSVAGAGTSAGGNGNTLTLVLNLSFTPGFAGNKVVYMAARDLQGGNSGWQALGTWGVPGASIFPSADAAAPARGTGLGQTAVFTFSDTKGYQDLGVVNVLINDFLDGRHACYLAYSRPLQVLYLVNDTGTALSSGLPLNASGSVSNGQCTVTSAGSSVTGNGNTLTLTLNLAFNPAFAGNRVIYLAARDSTDANNSGWQALGTWTVQ